MKFLLLFSLLSFFLCACRKEEIQPDFSSVIVSGGKELKALYFIDSLVGFVSVGKYEEEGYICKTTDGGSSWLLVFDSHWSVNDIGFLDASHGYACGDSLHIIKTTDQGITWTPVELSWYPASDYIVPLKHLEFADDTTWFFTGGRYYHYGINVRTQNGGYWWDNEVFQVELNSSWFRDEKYGLLAGYGVIYVTPDANVSFKPSDFIGDNITSMSFIDSVNGIACGYNGGIYRTRDGGGSWGTVLKPNGYLGRRLHFNAVEYTTTGLLAAGNEGLIYYSGNGESWTKIETGFVNDFFDIEYINGFYMIAGEDGVLIKIRI
jgi:photosystem II stability/assembly factor-like uncharacterized protein